MCHVHYLKYVSLNFGAKDPFVALQKDSNTTQLSFFRAVDHLVALHLKVYNTIITKQGLNQFFVCAVEFDCTFFISMEF